MAEVEFTLTKRGARTLHLNGYQYTLNKRGHNGNTYWRCVDRSCGGRATLDPDDDLVSENNSHSHPPNHLQVVVSKAVDCMKERASTESTPLPAVYRETMVAMSQHPTASAAAANVPTLPSLQTTLQRSRRKRLPPMPSTIDDVCLTGDWARTLKGEPFVLGSEDNIHVLATDTNVTFLAEADELYMDGTFKVSPRLFYQVFMVHAFKHGKQFPFAYCLLPNKTKETYVKCLSILSKGMDDLHLRATFERVTTDFEIAMIQAIQEVFPSASTKGCFFHYSQAVWRKVQNLGLQEEYRSNLDLSRFVSKILALSLCPVRFVRVAWSAIKAAAPQVSNINELCRYFENTWLNGEFPIPSWNHHETEGPRTNNHLEGWHRRMNGIAGKKHPNIYELVELFQAEQASTEVTIEQLGAGGAVRRRGKFYRVKDRSIQRIRERFNNGTYTLEEYIDNLSKWMGFF